MRTTEKGRWGIYCWERGHGARGFTIVELLVVIAILGILIAIAIPQFMSYRKRAVDEYMIRDLKNAAIAMESYFAEKKAYPSSLSAITGIGFRQSPGVTMAIAVTSPSSFTLTATAINGTQPSYSYSSNTGSIQ